MKVCPECGGSYPVAEGFCPMDGARLQEPDDGDARPDAVAARALLGRVLDRRYRLDEVIGIGGMGFVYRATHTLIGKSLAIKILRSEHVEDTSVLQRFLQEARLASGIKHPNVVDISDFGQLEEGNAYYVMEMLVGRTLADHLDNDGPFDPKTALSICLQIVAGLGAAHEGGTVHRDLKPDNVFLCKRPDDDSTTRVKLLDFGIARAAGPRITVAGAILGTPEYMSPEQAQGKEVDARADLYAVGIILFEMLTGLVPYGSDDVGQIIRQHLHAAPPSLGDVEPRLRSCTKLDAAITKLLAKDPDDRPADVTATAQLLTAAMEADLGRETAARVTRSTRAIGSGSVGVSPASQGSPEPMAWGARTGSTQVPEEAANQVGGAAPAAPNPAGPALRPGPDPIAVTDPATLEPRRSPPVAVIMTSTAVVAGLVTFGVFAALGRLAPSATHPESSAPQQDVDDAYTSPGASQRTPAAVITPMAAPQEAAPGDATPTTQLLPPAEPVRDVGPTPTAPPAKEASGDRSRSHERSTSDTSKPRARPPKSGASRPSKPTAPKSSKKPPTSSPMAPGTDDPEPEPKQRRRVTPGDLKDPFSRN